MKDNYDMKDLINRLDEYNQRKLFETNKSLNEFVYNNYFKAFPGLKNYFELVLAKAEHFDYILFNNITGRKLFISLDEPFVKYKNLVKSPEFWYDLGDYYI